MTVGILPHKRLENRRSQLEYQGNDTDLRKSKTKTVFQQGIHGRDNRLNHVVQQMTETHRKQNSVCGTLSYPRVSFEFS